MRSLLVSVINGFVVCRRRKFGVKSVVCSVLIVFERVNESGCSARIDGETLEGVIKFVCLRVSISNKNG